MKLDVRIYNMDAHCRPDRAPVQVVMDPQSRDVTAGMNIQSLHDHIKNEVQRLGLLDRVLVATGDVGGGFGVVEVYIQEDVLSTYEVRIVALALEGFRLV